MLFFFPLGKKGSSGFPIFTLFICVVCAIVFAFGNGAREQLALAYYPGTYDVLKMFTSVFTHAGFWPLLANLIFFYCFARTIETQISISGYLFSFVVFVLVTNLAYGFAENEAIPTIGLSGVVCGYMGMFLLRYPREYIDLWFIKTIEVPALIFILAFFALNVAAYRDIDNGPVNYIAHFSGFAAGALFKVFFWKMFTTEKPEPKRKAALRGRPGQARVLHR